MSKGPVRRIRLRAMVAYPAVSVALVAAVALALTPFGPSQGVALAATATPTETATASVTPTTTTATATAPTTATPSVTTTAAPTPSPSSGVAVPVDHHVLARIEGPQFQANYLPVDEPVIDALQFQTFRVRFTLHNAGTQPIAATPRLEFRPEGAGRYVVVPEKPLPGVPFRVAREWVPSLGLGGGTMQSELGEDIAVADFRAGKESGLALTGHRSMGVNPDQPVTLPSASYTEQEFTVSLSIDAQYGSGYELRVTDGGTALTGTDVATIRLGPAPTVQLSPGQRHGVAVADPTPVTSTAGRAFPAIFAASSSATSSVPAASATTFPDTIRYPLVAGTPTATIDPQDQIHGPYSMTTDKCGICHRTHTARAPNLLAEGSPSNLGSQSVLCLACHDGTGANSNVQGQYALVRPVNDPVKREYYSHDAVAATPSIQHTQSQLNEFGSVDGASAPLNRHSECADCHNPHQATASTTRDATQNTDGWGASGRLTGVSGVSVGSAAAGSTPAFTFLSGVETDVVPANLVTREYQLCFKCHSGSTTLPPPIAGKPSKDYLDKGAEFNPANPSFHPIEAAGKNDTPAMKASLAGASTEKLWDFTVDSTIRCLNCHASSTTPGTLPLPLPGSALVPHTSSNRGILIRNYRDRSLKPRVDVVLGGVPVDKAAYDAGDFALCYVCHGQAPFGPADSTIPADATSQTNFKYHSKHLTGVAGKGSPGTDIDTAGDGGGNAICAECHFRLHSTTNKVGAQTLTGDPVTGSRLVNFAPNVTAFGGVISWTSTGTGSGSCTLTCHSVEHDGYTYSP